MAPGLKDAYTKGLQPYRSDCNLHGLYSQRSRQKRFVSRQLWSASSREALPPEAVALFYGPSGTTTVVGHRSCSRGDGDL